MTEFEPDKVGFLVSAVLWAKRLMPSAQRSKQTPELASHIHQKSVLVTGNSGKTVVEIHHHHYHAPYPVQTLAPNQKLGQKHHAEL